MLMLIAATPTTTGGGSSGGASVFPIILLLAIAAIYLIFVRPQRRKQKLQQGMQSELAVGDEVLTAGGVYGTVTRLGDDEVRVEIAPNVEVRLARRAIAVQLTDPADAPEDTTSEPDDASDERWQSAFDGESDKQNPG